MRHSQKDDREERVGEDATGAHIIPFKGSSTPSASGNIDAATNARNAIIEEDRARMRQNLAAAVVLIVLLLVGGRLVMHLRTSLRVEGCLEAGYRNCSALKP